MKIIENEKKHICIQFTDVNSEEMTEQLTEDLDGFSYYVGEFAGNPEQDRVHEARVKVLEDYGLTTDGVDVIIIKDESWNEQIEDEIAGYLKTSNLGVFKTEEDKIKEEWEEWGKIKDLLGLKKRADIATLVGVTPRATFSMESQEKINSWLRVAIALRKKYDLK